MGGLKGENEGCPRAGAIQSSRAALVVEHSADSKKMIYWVILKPDGGLGTCDWPGLPTEIPTLVPT